jgi:hypothetical protein
MKPSAAAEKEGKEQSNHRDNGLHLTSQAVLTSGPTPSCALISTSGTILLVFVHKLKRLTVCFHVIIALCSIKIGVPTGFAEIHRNSLSSCPTNSHSLSTIRGLAAQIVLGNLC